MERTNFLTPVGRLVAGSLYKLNDKDADGNPLLVKNGPNKGQPRTEVYFALAIPKVPGHTHWAQTEWGAIIYRQGQTEFPQAHQSPQFAWKVQDGDSAVPNSKGKVPNQQVGRPGHWVLSYSSGYPPKVSRDGGKVPLTQPDAVNLGDYVQVFGSVGGNGSQQRPGVYLNHSMVDLSAFGERITVGPDAASVGFGQNIMLPAGASATPPASMTPATAAAMAAPPASMTPATAAAMAAPPAAAPAFVPPPVVVAPNPAFLMPPPAAVVAPPPAPVRQMTAKAAGATYEQLLGAGWTDQLLVQHGMMVA